MGNLFSESYSKGSSPGVISMPETYSFPKKSKLEYYGGGSTPGIVEGYGARAAVIKVTQKKEKPTKAREYSLPNKAGILRTVKNGGSSPGVV